jgi:hypothetical protein
MRRLPKLASKNHRLRSVEDAEPEADERQRSHKEIRSDKEEIGRLPKLASKKNIDEGEVQHRRP